MDLRLFVAIPIPTVMEAPLARFAELITRRFRRVTIQRRFHVTIRFLGPVPESDANVVATAVERAVAGVACFPLGIAGIGTFPPKGLPKVLYHRIVTGGEELERLRLRVDEALDDRGIPPEQPRRRFRPHITCARFRAGVSIDRERLDREAPVVTNDAAEMTLYRSQLASTGAIHTPLTRISLRRAT